MEHQDGGFSLMEVLVALAISAVLIATTYRGLALGTRGLQSSDIEARVVEVAKAELARAGVEYPLAEGIKSGRSGNVSWSLSIVPYATPETAEDDFGKVATAFWIEVEAKAKRGHSVRLTTLKLGPANGP